MASTENFFKEKVKEYQEKKQAHLYWPTPEKPLRIKQISFYPDRFTYENNTYFYSKIEALYYLPAVTSSIIGNDRTVTFMIAGINEKDGNPYRLTLASNILKGVLKGSIDRKEFEQLSIANELIAKNSFETRVSAYLNELAEKGFFTYDEIKFHENGDIVNKKGKLVANLKKEFAEGNVSLGTVWASAKRTSTNPYEFSINSGAPKIKFLGMESGSKISFETVINHDAFKHILSYFQEHSSYPS